MKVEVINSFIDKYDHTTEYMPGQTLDLADADRCDDLVNRGLVKVIAVDEKPKPKKTARKAAE